MELVQAYLKFLIWNLFKLTSYSKFGFSRPDLDGNKLAKGECLARKASDEKCLSSSTEGRHFEF